MCIGYAGIILGCAIYSAMTIDDTSSLELVGITKKDLSAPEQILQDWRAPYVKDVKIIEADQQCADFNGFDLFQSEWSGARDLYYRDSRFYTAQCTQNKQVDFEKCKREHLLTEADPIQLTIFKNKRICGIYMDEDQLQNGTGYLGVIHPQDNGECPDGYRMCGQN